MLVSSGKVGRSAPGQSYMASQNCSVARQSHKFLPKGSDNPMCKAFSDKHFASLYGET